MSHDQDAMFPGLEAPAPESAAFDLTTERINRGLSIRALSAATGVHQHTIRALEGRLGEPRPVTESNAKKIADYFGRTVLDLIDEDLMPRAIARTR